MAAVSILTCLTEPAEAEASADQYALGLEQNKKGFYLDAQESFRKALLSAPANSSVASGSALALGQIQIELGRLASAEQPLTRALKEAPGNNEKVAALNALARLWQERYRRHEGGMASYDKSRAYLHQALESVENAKYKELLKVGTKSSVTARIKTINWNREVAAQLRLFGELEADAADSPWSSHLPTGEAYLNRAYTVDATTAPDSLDVAQDLCAISKLHQNAGDWMVAEESLGKGIGIIQLQANPAPGKSLALARALSQQAALCAYVAGMGKSGRAKTPALDSSELIARQHRDQVQQLSYRALTLMESVLGATHPDLLQDLDRLAVEYEEKKKFAEADKMRTRSIAIIEKSYGKQDPRWQAAVKARLLLLQKKNRENEGRAN